MNKALQIIIFLILIFTCCFLVFSLGLIIFSFVINGGSISLDEIRQRVKDPDWWYATRAMPAFALVVAEAIDAKYIVPTDIAMAYGIIKDGDNKK